MAIGETMTEALTTAETTTEAMKHAEVREDPVLYALPDPDVARINPQEFGTLAAQMAGAYRRQVNFYKNEYGRDLATAMELAAGANTDGLQEQFLAGLREQPADQVTWGYLRHLEDGRTGDALRKWEEVKAFAKDELTSGQRGAAAVEELCPSQSGPLGRARYSALVAEMAKDWAPLTGIEMLLIEQMAQAYTMQLHWTAQYSYYCVYRTAKVDEERGMVTLPRVTESQMVSDAAAMVDRWNRMFLRCLRQLRDLRRYSAVVINNPAQVNLANQQVNVGQPQVNLADPPGDFGRQPKNVRPPAAKKRRRERRPNRLV